MLRQQNALPIYCVANTGFKGHASLQLLGNKGFPRKHMVTKTAPESVALAQNGCDLSCGNMYINLLIAHKEGLVAKGT